MRGGAMAVKRTQSKPLLFSRRRLRPKYTGQAWLDWYRRVNRVSAERGELALNELEGKYQQHYQRLHENGGGSTVALRALEFCALHRLPVPDWLTLIVHDAVKIGLTGT